jgi:hypothetical protein
MSVPAMKAVAVVFLTKPLKEDLLFDANDLTTLLRRCLFRSGAPSMAGRGGREVVPGV